VVALTEEVAAVSMAAVVEASTVAAVVSMAVELADPMVVAVPAGPAGSVEAAVFRAEVFAADRGWVTMACPAGLLDSGDRVGLAHRAA
jgi:hypothetical protein